MAVIGLFSGKLAGQAPAAAGPDVITNAQVLWGLSNEDKQKLHPIRLEMLVYYYDPVWQLIWGECDGRGSFLPVRGEPLPIKPGQRVRIEGTIQPARGILRNEVKVTVLAEHAMPDAIPTKGILADSSRLDAQWSSLEGFVYMQREIDPNHIEYGVVSDGWLVTVRVLVDATAPVLQLVGALARFNGVYVGDHDANHVLQRISYWVPRLTDVTALGELDEDARFKLPRTSIGELDHAAKLTWVRLQGEIREFNPGQSLTIRDSSGQLTVPTPQPAKLRVGDTVEIVGRVAGDGAERRLAEPLFRPRSGRTDPGRKAGNPSPRLNLRVVDQIMELPLSEVALGYSVTLKGVVTWSDPRVDVFYLQDGAGGIGVAREPAARCPAVGEAVEVRGTTYPGRFAPEIKLLDLTTLGPVAVPRPRPVTLEQAMIGTEEARLVQIRGYLRQAVPDGFWTRLDFTTASGELSAYTAADDYFATLRGAIVQVTGVCSATADDQRQLTGVRLWVSGRESISVEVEPPSDPFSAPRITVSGLKQFSGVGAFNRRALVSGALISQLPGRNLVLQDGESGVLVFARDPKPLTIGQTVEVTGLPGREGSRVVLREAIARPVVGAVEGPAPLELDELAEPRRQIDCRLVRLRAGLSQSAPQKEAIRLTLREGGVIFDAELSEPGDWKAPEPGSRLELTGVYLLEFDEHRQPRGFRLQLRSPADVRIISAPVWWTTGRAFAMAGALAVCTVLGIGWVTVLRRRVREQTEQIRRQIDKEARMQVELERASRLDSLGVLAGGIAHDFNNLLTAILGNLGLIRLEPEAMALVGSQVTDAEKAARRATDVTQQLLTFAKGGDPVRKIVDFAEVVREAAGFARHGSNVLVEFDFGERLPPAEVDASQVSRVVHNLVLNAVQSMAGGGVVRLTLREQVLETGEVPPLAAGHYLRLWVADHGPGIPAERLPRIFEPYFTTKTKGSGLGLATCHSIIKKHLGHIAVRSLPGVGTTFEIWLPAAAGAVARGRVPTAPAVPGASARVLFMDDDEVVRNLARTLLGRTGHDAVLVTDGAEAVTAYQQAREAGNPYDLVILDLTVPGGIGGKDALAELLKIDSRIRAVASSGYSNDPVMSNHRAFGFSAVLAKPYTLEAFAQVINEVRRN